MRESRCVKSKIILLKALQKIEVFFSLFFCLGALFEVSDTNIVTISYSNPYFLRNGGCNVYAAAHRIFLNSAQNVIEVLSRLSILTCVLNQQCEKILVLLKTNNGGKISVRLIYGPKEDLSSSGCKDFHRKGRDLVTLKRPSLAIQIFVP